jgi:hypothetical protein
MFTIYFRCSLHPSFLFNMATLLETTHDVTLPQIGKSVTTVTSKELVSPKEIAQSWLSDFESSLATGKARNFLTHS